jgi:hypothetical protein
MHSAATPEVGTAAAASAEVSATTSAAAEMGTPAATAAAAAETAGVCRFSRRRQTKGKGYCGRARRDFPHDMPSSSGQMRKSTPDRPVPFRRIEP